MVTNMIFVKKVGGNKMWEEKKPDRDGVWLRRYPRNNDKNDSRQHVIGCVVIKGDKAYPMDRVPVLKYDLEDWWILYPAEMFYVEGA